MEVLWWLVPPVVTTALAMIWVGIAGRNRDDVHRDDSEEALLRMQKALSKPAPRRSVPPARQSVETTHGVAVRRASRPTSGSGVIR